MSPHSETAVTGFRRRRLLGLAAALALLALAIVAVAAAGAGGGERRWIEASGGNGGVQATGEAGQRDGPEWTAGGPASDADGAEWTALGPRPKDLARTKGVEWTNGAEWTRTAYRPGSAPAVAAIRAPA